MLKGLKISAFSSSHDALVRKREYYVPGMNYALRKTVSAGEEDSVNTVCPSHVHYTV